MGAARLPARSARRQGAAFARERAGRGEAATKPCFCGGPVNVGAVDDGAEMTVFLAGSVGGHLELLEALVPALGARPRRWVTTDGARPRGLIESGERVEMVPALDRTNFSLRRLVSGVTLAARTRPRIIITSGAGTVAPFCLMSRLLGAKLLFVETMARVQDLSVTGRVLRHFAERVLVQWPELKARYPSATVCAPLLLAGDRPVPANHASGGTFISVGSHHEPFTRLLDAVDDAFADGVLPLPATAQVGPGQLSSPGVDQHARFRPADFAEAMERHAVIVCHGGAGVIATALRGDKVPLVFTRRRELNEHVDDHQVQLVRKLQQLGLIVAIDTAITAAAVDAALSSRPSERSFGDLPSAIDEVRSWLGGQSR
jgi:UDP-N-acetylglucosamine--N-acetylmuramyl-(pentapeptide) pyrophosphoryl-undecaprenol N-acetylglucosamine transferase